MKNMAKKSFFEIFLKIIQIIEDYGSLIALFIMLILVNLAILLRLTINYESSSWEEVARFSSIWMYMLAIAIASREDSHLRSGFFDAYIHSEKNKCLLEVIFKIIMVVCIFIFILWSIDQTLWVFEAKQKSLVLMIGMWIPYLSFVVGGIFALIRTVNYLYFYFQKYMQMVKKGIPNG